MQGMLGPGLPDELRYTSNRAARRTGGNSLLREAARANRTWASSPRHFCIHTTLTPTRSDAKRFNRSVKSPVIPNQINYQLIDIEEKIW